MKKQKIIIMRIFTIIISSILLISMCIKVEASVSNLESTNLTEGQMESLITKERYLNSIMTIVFNALHFISLFLFIRGIIFIIKKERKKGIIYILIFIIFNLPSILYGLFKVPATNIQ